MANPKPPNMKHKGKGGASGVFIMSSGLVHTSDSNAGDERGTFVSFIEPPTDPGQAMHIITDSAQYPGTAPKLSTRWLRGGKGSTG